MMIRYNDFIKINESNGSVVGLAELNKVIKKIFDDTKVSAVNTTYEKNDDNGFKLIITLNNMYYDKTNVIHTKLIFYVNKEKSKLVDNYFHYLYDLNCKFRKISFTDIEDFERKVNDIFDNRKFGRDIKILSDLSIQLTSMVNKWLSENDVNTISLYNINYNPIVDVVPCDSMSFNFDINLDDIRFIKLIIKKISDDEFKLSFNENEWFKDITIDSLKAIPQTIGEIVKNHIL